MSFQQPHGAGGTHRSNQNELGRVKGLYEVRHGVCVVVGESRGRVQQQAAQRAFDDDAGNGVCRPISSAATMMSAFDTVWPADSVEFCPHPDAANLFVCGTYYLEKNEPVEGAQDVAEDDSTARKKQVRRGKCTLFAAEDETLCELYDL